MSHLESGTSKPTCTDDYDPNSLGMNEAIHRIFQMLSPLNAYEKIGIRQALNRILSDDINSTIDVPPFTNSAMDGYAIRFQDVQAEPDKKFNLVGTAYAGKPYEGIIQPGETIRIMTGACIPRGADTVVMQEHVNLEENLIHVNFEYSQGANVRERGEDLKIGESVLSKGRKLNAADIGLLASMGISEVSVCRNLRVAFFSTGDELRNIGEVLDEGQIYDSNRYTLYCMLKQLGCEILDMGIIADDQLAIEQAFKIASTNADIMITSGGVSVGDADFVKLTLEKLGKVNFWKIAMKPGRPLAVGKVNSCYFFGLPGNPVSAMVTFYQLVQPAIRFLKGQTQHENSFLHVRCVTTIKKRPGRVEFQRGVLFPDENGEIVVKTTGNQGSHVLSSMSKANCFVVLDQDSGDIEAGNRVKVQTFESLM